MLAQHGETAAQLIPTANNGVTLSLIIPAFNEANRLPRYLASLRDYFSRNGLRYEVLVVDDGSRDQMAEIVRREVTGWPELRLLQHATNRGRGQAIRTAVAAAVGDVHLYADADGATPIEEAEKLRLAIDQGADIAVGSRMISHPGLQRDRRLHRALIGKTFTSITRLFLGLSTRDTQCGFKMWRRDVGATLLALCKEDGFLLDTELVLLAERGGYRVAEVPVRWSEIPGSKVHLIRDSWRMFRGLCRLRRSLGGCAHAGPTLFAGRPNN